MTTKDANGLSPEANAAIASLSLSMAKNPKTRRQMFAMAKEADPSVVIPADVQIENLRDELKASEENGRIERDRAAAVARQEAQRARLLEKYTPEDVKKIEDEIMTPKGIADYEVGATLYAAAQPQVQKRPEAQSHGIWELPTGDQSQLANPKKHALNKAYAVVDEINRNRRQA